MGGAGIEGGQIYGASDKLGAYPHENPVTPADFVATVYNQLGIEPHTEAHDQQDRPFTLTKGKTIPLQMS